MPRTPDGTTKLRNYDGIGRYIPRRKKDQEAEDLAEFYTLIKGRRFNGWVRGGHTTSDIVTDPAYIIESLVRDEIHTERELVITTKLLHDTYTISGLRYGVMGYYVDSYIYNVTRNEVATITASAAEKILVLDAEHTSWQEGDNVFVTNIKPNIDTTSFDAVGNTTNGTRKSWVMGRFINSQMDSREIIEQICLESFLIYHKSFNQKKISTLDAGTTVGTLSKPLYSSAESRHLIDVYLTPIDYIYTDFTLNYHYDYARKIYREKLNVNKSTSSNASLDSYKAVCAATESNYRIRRKFEYNSDWIYATTLGGQLTAYAFLGKLIKWFTSQRLIVDYTGDVKDHIQYEIGDQVLIDSTMLPVNKSGSAKFIITQKRIVPLKGRPEVRFRLVELPE